MAQQHKQMHKAAVTPMPTKIIMSPSSSALLLLSSPVLVSVDAVLGSGVGDGVGDVGVIVGKEVGSELGL